MFTVGHLSKPSALPPRRKAARESLHDNEFPRRLKHFGLDDSTSLLDGENLIHFDGFEDFCFPRRGPFYFDQINDLGIADTKVKAQVALRHDAGARVDLVDLRVFSDRHASARANRAAITLRANQFEFDPIVLISPVISQERRSVIHVEDHDVDVSIVVVISKSAAAAGKALIHSRTQSELRHP